MNAIKRHSPVTLDIPAEKIEHRDGWQVVQKYRHEGRGPHLVDLSHLPRLDVQDSDLSSLDVEGVRIPEEIGACEVNQTLAACRMNRTQANIWHLAPGGPAMPGEPAFTDIRESTACLAVIGPEAIAVLEKVCRLDLAGAGHNSPCLIQGSVAGVACRIVVLDNSGEGQCFVFTCPRGYAQDMVKTLLAAGREKGLRPAGEECMTSRIKY